MSQASPHEVEVEVPLIGIGSGSTVVTRITDGVGVRISLIDVGQI